MNSKSQRTIFCLLIILSSNIFLSISNETAQADVSKFQVLYSMDLGVRPDALDWNPDGTQFAIGLQNGYINIYNSSTFKLELSINATYYPTDVIPKWNPNGSLIAGGGNDNHIYIFDAVTGKQLKSLFIYHGYASSLAWSPDGKFLANGNPANNLTQIWNIETGKKVIEFGPDNMTTDSRASGVAWSPDGTKLYTSSRSLDVWYTSNWTKTFSIKNDYNVSCALSPDGKFLAIFDMPYKISIYKTNDMSLYRNISSSVLGNTFTHQP